MPIRTRTAHFFQKLKLSSLVYPSECAFCQSISPTGGRLCDSCQQLLAKSSHVCQRCAMPLSPVLPNRDCVHCRHHRWSFSRVVSLGHYQGKLREAVILCKKLRFEPLRYGLAELLADRVRDQFVDLDVQRSLLVPVPNHWSRAWARTAATAQALSELLSKLLGISCVSHTARRIRRTGKQGMLSLAERQQNVRGAFRIRHPTELTGRHLFIVDDVLTSGSTANELARQLRKAKPADISVITIARATGR